MKKTLMLLMVFLLVLGCGCSGDRGLYSSEIASEHFLEQKDALDRVASWMIDNPNIVYVLRGENSHWDDTRCYEQVDSCSVYSKEPLTQAEIAGLKTDVIPAFNDPMLESIREIPESFAKYIWFVYNSNLFDTGYQICKEYDRCGNGSLTDWGYYQDMTDLGEDWFAVGYGG